MPGLQVKHNDIADKITLDIVAGKASNISSTTSTQSATIDTIKQNLETSNTSVYESISDASDTVDSISSKIKPAITIITKPFISVSATKDGSTISGTTDTNGKCRLILPEIGTWVVSASNGTLTTQSTVVLTNSQWTRSVYLELFSATLNVNVDAGAEVTISHSGESSTAISNSNGIATFEITKSGDYTISAMKENTPSEAVNINITEDHGVYTTSLSFRKINITAKSGASVTIVNGSTTISFTSDGSEKSVYIPNDGTWQITGTLSGEILSETIIVDSFTTYNAELAFTNIYGIEWDGSSSPQCTRTDDSALFVDPNPYMADGNHPGSSPFDACMPWSGMVKETINGDVFVKIPKFWFKVTTNGTRRKIQIADKAVTGFSVSPAHQDRGDGKGERDYIYVSRYHVSTDYKSISSVLPLVNITRSEARSGCSGRGTGYCQFDMMTLISIWYLYLVEFAHWDSQEKIGHGGGNNSSIENLGASDTMPYHTGTMQSYRGKRGVGTQYRWIEDLWGNVMNWVDGIYFSDANIYAIKNPANFSDSSDGTLVGTRPTTIGGEIKAWKDSTVSGYEWFIYPSEVYSDSFYATYCCDLVHYSSSGVVLCFGCYYYTLLSRGLFYLNGNYSLSNYYSDVGARLLYLP